MYRKIPTAQKKIPMWAKRAKKTMDERGITQRRLAEELKLNASQLSGVLNGLVSNDRMADIVCAYLKIER